jgi:hypothetical protein
MTARVSRAWARCVRERWIRRRWTRFAWVREWDRFQELNRLNKGQRVITRRTRGSLAADTRYRRCRAKRAWREEWG